MPQRHDVTVVGQIARDLVLRVDHVPDAGMSAPVRERRETLGGKAANQAVGLAQLGADVALVGVVGDDPVGERMLAHAEADGIDIRPVIRRSGAPTGLIVDIVDANARWRYLEDLPEPMLLTAADIEADASFLAGARAVCVQLQQPPAAALAAVRIARAAGSLVVLDGAPADLVEDLLACADVLRADARETELLVGRPVADAAAALAAGRALLDRGPRLVALAAGAQGNVFVWTGGSAIVPLSDAPVVDTTGAGDAFTAALTLALLRGAEPGQAATAAAAAATATVGHAGGRPSLSRDQEVQRAGPWIAPGDEEPGTRPRQ
jgi:ribokinase